MIDQWRSINLVKETAHRPYIRRKIVTQLIEPFRRHVVRCAYYGVQRHRSAAEETAQAQVAQFDAQIRSDEHVGRFDICYQEMLRQKSRLMMFKLIVWSIKPIQHFGDGNWVNINRDFIDSNSYEMFRFFLDCISKIYRYANDLHRYTVIDNVVIWY